MGDINLKLLQTFVIAAEHGNLRRTAELTNRSPSAITLQIKELEKQLGLQLFERSRQRVRLTADGQAFFDELRAPMGAIRDGVNRMQDLLARRKGRITIACAPTLVTQGMVDVLNAYLRRYPESTVSVKEAAPREAAELLKTSRVELYLGPRTSDLEDLGFEQLFEEWLVACVPHPLDEQAETLSLKDLSRFPIILLDERTAVRGQVDELARSEGVELSPRFEMQSAHSALALAASGMGIAVLPQVAVRMADFSRLRSVPVAAAGAHRGIGITKLRGQVHNNHTTQLLKLIRDRYSDPGKSGAT